MQCGMEKAHNFHCSSSQLGVTQFNCCFSGFVQIANFRIIVGSVGQCDKVLAFKCEIMTLMFHLAVPCCTLGRGTFE